MDDYTRKMIRIAVAQTCLNVGWSTIHSSPLEILTDLLSDYILGLCKRTNNYAFLFNQTEPNLDHLGLAFMDLGISLPELEEYVNYFDNNNCPEIAQYPVPKESSLNFLKPGSREVVTRPVHIHEHLPPMYPHLEEQETAGASKLSGGSSPPQVEAASTSNGETPTSVSPGSGLKRRGDTPTVESFAIRRARALAEEETRQLREISSVMMTTSGFLSHAREGKLPEVRTIIPEPEPEEQPPQPPPPPQVIEPKVEPLPPTPEVKQEKKKKKKSHDPSKKVEKVDKNKDDITPVNMSVISPSLLGVKSSTPNLIPDDSQIKKLTTVKETNKLKALKPGATKAIAITPNSFTPSPRPEKKHKPKRPNSPAAAIASQSPLGMPKAKISRPEKLQNKERIVVDDVASDAFPDIKLTAEPDRQKLNIFKKISKVKDDHDETERPDIRKMIMEVDGQVGVKLGKDVTVELVPVAIPKKPVTPPSEIKEEKEELAVDVENFHSPTTIGSVSFCDEIMPGTPTTPKTPDIPQIPSDHKKKKREKHKEKKERDKFVSSPVSSRMSDDNILSKPKTPEVIVDAPDDHFPPFSFLGYPAGPTIIPPNLASNPLIPQIRVSDAFGPRIPPPLPVNLPHPLPPKEVATPISTPVSTTPNTPSTPSTTPSTESPVAKKKDKKEKKNKEKIKKKKEKKESKKSKEKSEKKKLKLMKKQKLEEKIKLKKEKKDKKKETQSHEEKRGDSPSVPKITFKLGPDPQREQSPNPKITFKPLVKKEDDVGEPPKKHSSDQAASTPVAKHHKGSSSKSSKIGGATESGGHQKLHDSPLPTKTVAPLTLPAAAAVPKVEPETNESNQLWICPACGRPDDGSPMIACDACDMWYHYVCVGIQEAPESDWFCQGCISKKPDLVDKKKKHKKRK
uniref:Transcription initiation factor TFIID subunit 3 n=1 Tax=Lygus hesperus TaxID=30085 RepID=A0A146LLZ1_LYGHE